MASARLKFLINLLLFIQVVYGQQSSSINGPSTGQNSYNQAFQNNACAKSPSDNLLQNGKPGNLATNPNTHLSVNFQPLVSQSPIPIQPTISLQQPQSITQPINLQLSHIPNFQQATIVQPSLQFSETSFSHQPLIPQSAIVQQQQNLPQTSNLLQIPLNIQQIPCLQQQQSQQSLKLGDFNNQQQLPNYNPLVPQISVQPAQGISIPNAAFISPYSSLSTVSSFPIQQTEYMNNLGNNYLGPLSTVPFSIIETPQIATPYSTLPIMAILTTPNSSPLVTDSMMAYNNQASNIRQSPLHISNDFFEDEHPIVQDNFTSLLLALLELTKKSSKYAPTLTAYPGNPCVLPYSNQGSKSSSIKALLPLIFNLINERKEGCGCREACQNCDRRRKTKKDVEPKIYSGYSKKRDYTLREEMFENDVSLEENSRKVRDYKKSKKVKQPIPIMSEESFECEVAQYEGLSGEEVD